MLFDRSLVGDIIPLLDYDGDDDLDDISLLFENEVGEGERLEEEQI